MSLRLTPFVLTLLLAGSTACGPSSESAVAADVAAVRTARELPGGGVPSAAVVVSLPEEARVFAFPTRLPRLLDAVGLGAGSPPPHPDEAFRCREERVVFLYDSTANELGEIDALCRGQDPRIALLRLRNGDQYTVPFDPPDVDRLVAEPTLVGDIVFGASSVTVTHPGHPDVEPVGTSAPDLIRAMVAAVGPAQELRPSPPPPCMAATEVTFLYRHSPRSRVTLCDDAGPTAAPASFWTPDPATGGTIAVDAGEIRRVEAAMRE